MVQERGSPMVVNRNCLGFVVIRENRPGRSHVRKHNLPRVHVVHNGLNEGRSNKLLGLRRDRHLKDAIVD